MFDCQLMSCRRYYYLIEYLCPGSISNKLNNMMAHVK